MKVLIFTSSYLPGFKAGGPIRSIVNLVQALGDEIEFFIVTRDRDLGDLFPYQNIEPDSWMLINHCYIYYSSPKRCISKTLKIIREFQGDVLYLKSFFSTKYSILPLLIARLFKRELQIVIGPSGEFSRGALNLKTLKKSAYIFIAKCLGLYRIVKWQASTHHEADDIRRVFGLKTTISISINISNPPVKLALHTRCYNAPLRILFLSRISPMKNLHAAIEILRQVSTQVVFDTYGPLEDTDYWKKCQEASNLLPNNIQFNYCGALHPAQVHEVLAGYDLFFLPTLGENFGHVIAEALSCGLPVLISDQTPWRDLETRALGWDISLSEPNLFVACIEKCSRLPAADYNLWRQYIRDWAQTNIGNEEAISQNRQLFLNLGVQND